jgi:membrane protease YdiL (CAAX protease family)
MKGIQRPRSTPYREDDTRPLRALSTNRWCETLTGCRPSAGNRASMFDEKMTSPGTHQLAPSSENAARIRSMRFFLFFTYLFSWSIWGIAAFLEDKGFFVELFGLKMTLSLQVVILAVGSLGPGLAALLELSGNESVNERRSLSQRIWDWSLNAKWFPVVVLGPILVVATSYATCLLVTKSSGELDSPFHWSLLFALNLPLAPLWEEIGWRGFLLPRLQATGSAFRASLLVALAWAPWHLPLLIIESHGTLTALSVGLFVVETFAISVIFTWVCNRTGGRLLGVILLHGSHNASLMYFALGLDYPARSAFYSVLVTISVLLAALILALEGRDLGLRRTPASN